MYKMQKNERTSTITRFCAGHREAHDAEAWAWTSIRVGRKKVWYCNKCINCAGCNRIHLTSESGGARTFTDPQTGKSVWVCFKHTTPTRRSLDKRMADMSPEEVLSGSHITGDGKDPAFITDSKSGFSKEHKEGVQELKKALDY